MLFILPLSLSALRTLGPCGTEIPETARSRDPPESAPLADRTPRALRHRPPIVKEGISAIMILPSVKYTLKDEEG